MRTPCLRTLGDMSNESCLTSCGKCESDLKRPIWMMSLCKTLASSYMNHFYENDTLFFLEHIYIHTYYIYLQRTISEYNWISKSKYAYMLPSKSWDHKLLNGNHGHFFLPVANRPVQKLRLIQCLIHGQELMGGFDQGFFSRRTERPNWGFLEDLLLFCFFCGGGGV